jgi:hypothetical protein
MPGWAAPPPGAAPDPERRAWFESLCQPQTHQRCCSISDCRFTAHQLRDGHYEVQIDGWTYRVPRGVVLRDTIPTGHAVACYTDSVFGTPLPRNISPTTPQNSIEILCLVPDGRVS